MNRGGNYIRDSTIPQYNIQYIGSSEWLWKLIENQHVIQYETYYYYIILIFQVQDYDQYRIIRMEFQIDPEFESINSEPDLVMAWKGDKIYNVIYNCKQFGKPLIILKNEYELSPYEPGSITISEQNLTAPIKQALSLISNRPIQVVNPINIIEEQVIDTLSRFQL